MSSHQLAGAVAAGGARPNTTPTPPPFNLLITSAVLGGVLAAVCAACYCCGRASRARKPREGSHASNIYTLSTECPHNHALYPDMSNDGYLPPRRPATPGPPPAYDSVVSSTDKLRRFGIVDDYVEDISKFDRYILHEGSTGPEELRNVITLDEGRLEDLSFCTIRRGCMDRFDPGDVPGSETGSEQNIYGKNSADGSSEDMSEAKTHNSEGSVSEMDEMLDFVSETSACRDDSSNEVKIHSRRVGILKTRSTDEEEVQDSSLPTYEVAVSIGETSKGPK